MSAQDLPPDELLRFARETPLTFGRWREIKALYKQLEAAPGTDPAVLATLIARLDAASRTVSTSIPEADLDLDRRMAHPAGMTASPDGKIAVITGSWEASALHLFDFDTPDALKPRRFGSLNTGKQNEWQEIEFADSDLLAVRIGSNVLRIIDCGDPDAPRVRGELKASRKSDSSRPQSGNPPPAEVSGFAKAAQMVRDAFGGPRSAGGSVPFANLQSISAVKGFVYVVCAKTSGVGGGSPSGLCVVDISDPDQPEVIGSLVVKDALNVVPVPGRPLVAVLSSPEVNQRGNQGSLHLIDVSDPRAPRMAGTARVSHNGALIAGADHVYVGVNGDGGGGHGVRIVDITDPNSPRRAGIVPLVGYYGYGIERLAVAGGFVYATLRYGRLAILDVRDPAQPKLIRELPKTYVNGLALTGGKLLVSTSDGITVWNLQYPERPTALGTPPSSATISYMKRRARRLLRTLAKTDPALFTQLATFLLSDGSPKAGIDPETNWVLLDLLFGGGGRFEQVSHGRGRMIETRSRGLSLRRREERASAAWDQFPERAAEILIATGAGWEAREMALKVLRANQTPLPVLPNGPLAKSLAAPSLLLIAEGVRQAVALAEAGRRLPPTVAAEAFAKGAPRLRTRLLSALQKRGGDAAWEKTFAERVLEQIPDGAGTPPSRRTVAVAALLFDHFAESVLQAKGDPILRLLPMLLASRHATLREQAFRAARVVTTDGVYSWVERLSAVSSREDLEQVLIALEDAVRGKSLSTKEEARFHDALLNLQPVGIESFWRVVAALAPNPAFLRALWTELLSDTTLEAALGVAMASPHALTLLGKSGITNDEMSGHLQERPLLIGLLSGPSFAVLTQTMPAAVTLRLIAAATDEAWDRLRGGWLRNLREGLGLEDLWLSAEAALKTDETGNLERRLVDDAEVASTILGVENTAAILEIREPSLAGPLGAYLTRYLDKITASDSLLVAAATHPLPEVRNPALAALQTREIRLPMALGLVESEVPASVAAGRRWFADADAEDLMTRALALCDSPVASVRAIGRDFVTERQSDLPARELAESLVEHADPLMQAFVARLLGREPAPQFDREILRIRNRSRDAKEIVKARQESLPAGTQDGGVETATLLALARGATTPRDADWALSQLVRRAMAGEAIDGLVLESSTPTATTERTN
ncbi:MAG: hypothetical protein H7Z41_19845 [Cytophagales bacterium]|nr:hypothetical protein [Armatimonadota bacterium]